MNKKICLSRWCFTKNPDHEEKNSVKGLTRTHQVFHHSFQLDHIAIR